MPDPSPNPADDAITTDQVRHVAKLARLSFDEPELEKFTTQLEHILEYVNRIRSLDTTGVEPVAHALPISNVLREDVAKEGLSVEDVLKNAPDTDPPFFKVPKIIGGDEDSAG